MNQQVQVLDGYVYSASDNELSIRVLFSGQTFTVILTDVMPDNAEVLYSTYQFDIEDYIEALKEPTAFDVNGELRLHISDIVNQ